MTPDITVCIPSIPPRRAMLDKAIASVWEQSLPPASLCVAHDHMKSGAALTRHRALLMAGSEWVAFLDDDDQFKPNHLQLLREFAQETGADLVFPWFDVIGGTDPFPEWEGVPWDNEGPVVRQVPITFLVRREVAMDVGGFGWFEGKQDRPDQPDEPVGEDRIFVEKVQAAGARIEHLPERTWKWFHHARNTSGLPSRW